MKKKIVSLQKKLDFNKNRERERYIMKRINVISVFLLSCLLFAGCDKHNDAKITKEIIGKWELNSVIFMDMDLRNPNIDYPKTAIYDFQKNGKLIITYSISGELQKSEHSYKYVRTNHCPTCDYPDVDKNGNNLQIDENRYLCDFSNRFEDMCIYGFFKNKKAIDDVDLVMMKYEDISWKIKTFYKSK